MTTGRVVKASPTIDGLVTLPVGVCSTIVVLSILSSLSLVSLLSLRHGRWSIREGLRGAPCSPRAAIRTGVYRYAPPACSSLAEVAARLDLSEGAVAERLERGRLIRRRVLTTELSREAAAHTRGRGHRPQVRATN